MSMTKAKLACGLAGAASLCIALGTAAPASADPGTGVTFWTGDFVGESVTYPVVTSACTTLPITAHSEFNNTTKTINVYRTTDCTGQALSFPASDFHSLLTFPVRSFRAVS